MGGRNTPLPLRLPDALLALLGVLLARELLLALLLRRLQVEGRARRRGRRRRRGRGRSRWRLRALRERQLHRADVPAVPAGGVRNAGNLDRSTDTALVDEVLGK